MSNHQGRVGVIGGGLAGLASACVLAARGRDVVLFEQNDWLGGKAARLEVEGFRFDMGPTILLMPSVLERIFAEAGRSLSEMLDLVPLDPQWRSFFNDGSTLDLVADVPNMCKALDAFSPGGSTSAGYRGFSDLAARLSNISDKFFFWRSIGSVWDMFDPKTSFQPSMLKDVLSMRPFSTVAGTIRSFVSEPRTAQMLDHFTQYVGSAPDLSPAVLCGIAHMQTSEGVWYPRGGTRAVPLALAQLARELGVEFRTNTEVKRILLDSSNKRVVGVETDSGRFDLDAVVSNSDSVRTHRELLPSSIERTFVKRRRYEPACSGVVLYLGLDRRYEHLSHHNFVFSRNAEEEFHSIYRTGEPAADPTCYVCAQRQPNPRSRLPAGNRSIFWCTRLTLGPGTIGARCSLNIARRFSTSSRGRRGSEISRGASESSAG